MVKNFTEKPILFSSEDKNSEDLVEFAKESTNPPESSLFSYSGLNTTLKYDPEVDCSLGKNSEHFKKSESEKNWLILVVDDDPSIFEVTKLALSNYEFRGKGIELLMATNEKDGMTMLESNEHIALVILDVVMENPDSGLRLVKYIRNQLGNNKIQIVLRTGQPGDQPEEMLVKVYAINDYKLKTELTRDKLFTCVTLALRAFDQSHNVIDLAHRLMVTNSKLSQLNESLESQVRERTEQVNLKSKELEEAYIDICNLLRIMTHDQNNYLAIILSSAELLTSFSNDTKILRRAESILWAVKSQRDLIQKITHLDALKTGKRTIKVVPTSMSDVIDKAFKTFENSMTQKNISFKLINSCPPETMILVEPTIFVSSVINNLLSNAIKFSPPASNIYLEAKPIAPDAVCISVRDEGIGMPKEIIDGLFSFSTRTNRPGTQGEKGTGFGMPIVKSLVEKMNGTIELTSQEKSGEAGQHGTKFSLIIKKAV